MPPVAFHRTLGSTQRARCPPVLGCSSFMSLHGGPILLHLSADRPRPQRSGSAEYAACVLSPCPIDIELSLHSRSRSASKSARFQHAGSSGRGRYDRRLLEDVTHSRLSTRCPGPAPQGSRGHVTRSPGCASSTAHVRPPDFHLALPAPPEHDFAGS